MTDGSPLEKARKAKRINDQRRRAKLAKKIDKIDVRIAKGDCSVTEACRAFKVATDAYYRFKKREKILTDASS